MLAAAAAQAEALRADAETTQIGSLKASIKGDLADAVAPWLRRAGALFGKCSVPVKEAGGRRRSRHLPVGLRARRMRSPPGSSGTAVASPSNRDWVSSETQGGQLHGDRPDCVGSAALRALARAGRVPARWSGPMSRPAIDYVPILLSCARACSSILAGNGA